jgi:hypothetical protein
LGVDFLFDVWCSPFLEHMDVLNSLLAQKRTSYQALKTTPEQVGLKTQN